VKLAHARGIFLLLDECYVYLQYAVLRSPAVPLSRPRSM
jgi:hypothetical protein